jgi:LEA14-like dessication related protein
MKKYFPFIFGAAALGALYYFMRLKKASDTIKVALSNIAIQKSGGLSLPTLVFKFAIQNPTNVAVNVLGITGDVYVNDNFLANATNLSKVVIQPYGETIYPVEVKAGLFDAASVVLSLLKKGTGLTVKADMNVNVDDILYPVSINKKVK